MFGIATVALYVSVIKYIAIVSRSSKAEVNDLRHCRSAANKPAAASFLPGLPPGLPLGFPPFLFPPTSLHEAIKENSLPAGFQFLQGLRQSPAQGLFPPGANQASLLDPNHAQTLLSLMRSQLPQPQPPPGLNITEAAAPNPPLDLTSSDTERPPAKKMKRDSSSSTLEDAPVSPPSSTQPPSLCRSLCSVTQPCSDQAALIRAWTVEQVAEFVTTVPDVADHAQAFTRERIDGSTLVLLTDEHLTSMGIKLGPAIKFR